MSLPPLPAGADYTILAQCATSSPTTTSIPTHAGAYRLDGEIAAGGMGVIYRAHDPALNRDVAVKVLRPEHAGDDTLHARFAFEARVMGRLQHPGIPPVHEVGSLPDGRPFLAMKLIQGETLAALIAGRASPEDDLPRLLGIFEQVCQTVAYAHREGVIHRDLKPANVMVGSFGEVQVMDWGLACPKDGALLGQRPSSMQQGVMGTPAYMAPEIVRGEQATERSDVFALGAILCDLLVASSTHEGSSEFRAIRAAVGIRSRTELDDCTADPQIVGLARRCLDESPAARPSDARALAHEIRAYQEGVRRRLREAELARIRSEERRVRLRLWAALAVLAAVVVSTVLHQRNEGLLARAREAHRQEIRDENARAALAESRRHAERALSHHDDVARWGGALDAAGAALRGIDPHADESIQVEATDERQRLEEARADLRLFTDIAAARDAQTRIAPGLNRFQDEIVVPLAFQALSRRGFREGGPLDEGERLARSRPDSIRREVIAALDLCLSYMGSDPRRGWVRGMLERIDDNPWRRQVRAAHARRDWAALEGLAMRPDAANQAPTSVLLLARVLPPAHGARIALLRAAVERNPGDFWLHQFLGHDLCRPLLVISGQREARGAEREVAMEAAGHFRAAVARRPGSAGALHNLACMLLFLGERRTAELAFRRVISLEPSYTPAYFSLAVACRRRGDLKEALAASRLGAERHPADARLNANLVITLLMSGRSSEAVNAARQALAARPGDSLLLSALGRTLEAVGEKQLALQYLAKAAQDDPQSVPISLGYADVLVRRGRAVEAEPILRRAVKQEPENGDALLGLAVALAAQARHAEALPVSRQAIGLIPDSALAQYQFGAALEMTGDSQRALEAYQSAAALAVEFTPALLGLGRLALKAGETARGVELYRRAVASTPEDGVAWIHLSQGLSALGRGREAFDAARRAVELSPHQHAAHCLLGLGFMARREPRKALACFSRAAGLAPGSAQYRFHEGEALAAMGKKAAALDRMRHAASIGGWPQAYPAVVEMLGERGEVAAALAIGRLAAHRHPRDGHAWRALAHGLLGAGEVPPALVAIEKAVAADPADPLNHGVHGVLLFKSGRFDDAAEATRRALTRLSPGDDKVRFAEGQLARCLEVAALDRKRKAVLAGDAVEEDAERLMAMANICHEIHRSPADAARLAERAIAINPARAEERGWRHFAAIQAIAAGRRGPALAWLREELESWKKRPAEARAQVMAAWRADPRLASVRGDAIEALPEAERPGWRAFWTATE